MTTPSLVWLVVTVNLYPPQQFGPYSDITTCNKTRDVVYAGIKHRLHRYEDWFLKLECK